METGMMENKHHERVLKSESPPWVPKRFDDCIDFANDSGPNMSMMDETNLRR